MTQMVADDADTSIRRYIYPQITQITQNLGTTSSLFTRSH